MTDETLVTDASTEAKVARVQGPRPAYLTYTLNEDGTLNVVDVSRKAEDVMAKISGNRDLKYVRFEIK